MTILRDVWPNCYRTRWKKGDVHPDTFAHPAKFQPNLIRRIYEHAFEEGWLGPGSTILDPFAGVGLGAYHALIMGLTWIGVELEAKHAATGQANIALWKKRYAGMPNVGDAIMLQGDSRTLLTWGRFGPGADACVGSPPYSKALSGETNQTEGDKLHIIAIRRDPDSAGAGYPRTYGTSPGQLAAMKEGSFEAAISSPNYPIDQPCAAQSRLHGSIQTNADGKRDESMQDPANLASMPEGDFDSVVDACISSPPYEASISNQSDEMEFTGQGGPIQPRHYSQSVSNLGNQSGETFWASARTILENCFALLRPGAHAIWVLGPYVRKGKLVDFPDQWRQLCEAVGFKTLHVHRCPKVEHYGTQATLDGGEEERKISRFSFFRRDAEMKRKARRYWQEVHPEEQVGWTLAASAQLPDKPLRVRLVRAQVNAYRDAGEPYAGDGQGVWYEDVICMERS